MPRIRAVCLDVGETLVNEARLWDLWADWLEVPRDRFIEELRAVIARGEHHRRVFERFRPNFDLALERRSRALAGWPPDVSDLNDLYPDALPALHALRAEGYRLAVAGNQPAEIERFLREIGVEIDVIGSSERWGIEKPSPAFFTRLSQDLGLAPTEVAYVGDRLDNDVLPAMEMGMAGIFIRRGPWGECHAAWPEASRASVIVDSLDDLPDALARL